jgi:hypothetical protein
MPIGVPLFLKFGPEPGRRRNRRIIDRPLEIARTEPIKQRATRRVENLDHWRLRCLKKHHTAASHDETPN